MELIIFKLLLKSLAYQEKVILLQKISEDIHIQIHKKVSSPQSASIQKFKGIAFNKT